ncbi:MAG: hypothetical protein HN929_12290 [Chloroflexi bacterium]|jgi:hypothetical protein|nr:hypothetical protein [Chloroflexota bacterium]MBT7082219.1 hypothetical protein [Chloroflexota bacterium]MBT7289284.1 hypothetical protein [Chloroflexota bacterium]
MGFLNFFKSNKDTQWEHVGTVKDGIDVYDDVPKWVAERIDIDRKKADFWHHPSELDGMHYIYRITPDNSQPEPIITVERRPR